jgi:hypothetical protein
VKAMKDPHVPQRVARNDSRYLRLHGTTVPSLSLSRASPGVPQSQAHLLGEMHASIYVMDRASVLRHICECDCRAVVQFSYRSHELPISINHQRRRT